MCVCVCVCRWRFLFLYTKANGLLPIHRETINQTVHKYLGKTTICTKFVLQSADGQKKYSHGL